MKLADPAGSWESVEEPSGGQEDVDEGEVQDARKAVGDTFPITPSGARCASGVQQRALREAVARCP